MPLGEYIFPVFARFRIYPSLVSCCLLFSTSITYKKCFCPSCFTFKFLVPHLFKVCQCYMKVFSDEFKYFEHICKKTTYLYRCSLIMNTENLTFYFIDIFCREGQGVSQSKLQN